MDYGQKYAHILQPLRIGNTVFRNRLFSAPNIKSTISDRGSITFGNDLSAESRQRIQGEVRDLIAVMHAGVLPAKLSDKPITEQITGPTLGADTIRKGKNAIVWSGIIVLVFMIIYYGFGGCVATFAVIMNLVLIMMAMIGMHAAFTLPGLAGLVLTVGNEQVTLVGEVVGEKNIEAVKIEGDSCSLVDREWV